MSQHNLGELVRSALLHSGCEAGLIKDLDNHATVQIELENMPSMYVGKIDESTVLWCDLCDFNESIVSYHSENLLREIMCGFIYSENKQLVIRESNDRLQLCAYISDTYLGSAELMAEAINAFFESQSRVMEIIRQ
ncbi:InvB/SpaK family type III secretion system chaperone [Glaciimonas immobilis]|uniref:Type III secretion system chaperone SpaK n=1 Tax=Glaciimonas immobilis TaxID=728004 RepID=A0A840RNX0_9BURK|nr:hypothetical protein [Glaciimonas immobilis]KAF3999330.1 hypothetical protein HAV38_05210 [Glaciimonas immobilis]MBB5198812.1 hypothetical protein [Glaciimonas immobilis]